MNLPIAHSSKSKIFLNLKESDVKAIRVTSIPLGLLSVIGSSYIIFSTFKRLQSSEKMNTFDLFPMIISVIDVALNTFQTTYYLLKIQNLNIPVDFSCSVLSFLLNFIVNIQAACFLLIGISLWVAARFNCILTFGDYYWRALVPCIVVPLFTGILQIVLGIYFTYVGGYLQNGDFCELNTVVELSGSNLTYVSLVCLLLCILLVFAFINRGKKQDPNVKCVVSHFPGNI
jgi:hypothetical protein